MQFSDGVAAAVGRTPLIKLRRASEETGCTILGKAEFMNPGQSVKDRAALFIVQDAIARGTLRPGGTVVEGTAGNTGIGLTVVGNALGFRTVIVIPETQSLGEKRTLCASWGPSSWRYRLDLTKMRTTTCTILSGSRLRSPRANRMAPSGPTNGITRPTGALTSKPRPRKSGPIPVARSTALCPPWVRAARWEVFPTGSRPSVREFKLRLPTCRGQRCTATTRPAS